MIGRVPRWLLVVGIVIAASGCDNVSWGGFDIRLEGPSTDSASAPSDTLRATAEPESGNLLGRLLYAGVRSGNRGRVVPVAEITERGLEPLLEGPDEQERVRQIIDERMAPGTELSLFHQGSRIGALVVDEAVLSSDAYCQPRPQASGSLLLLPQAVETQRFLALDAPHGSSFPLEPYQELASVYDQRVASLNLGAEAIPLVGAAWPPSLLDIRQELQILDLPGGEGPVVLATFVHRDQLQVGPAPDDAFSLMILGEPQGPAFRLTYTWYRPVGSEGKGAPRYFSRLDWDGDGEEEILLEVLGSQDRWFAALDRGLDGWQTTFQDPCGIPGRQGGGG